MPMRSQLVAVALVVFGHAHVAGINEMLSDRDISYALSIATGSDTARVAFHAPYILDVSDPTIEHLEVIT